MPPSIILHRAIKFKLNNISLLIFHDHYSLDTHVEEKKVSLASGAWSVCVGYEPAPRDSCASHMWASWNIRPHSVVRFGTAL